MRALRSSMRSWRWVLDRKKMAQTTCTPFFGWGLLERLDMMMPTTMMAMLLLTMKTVLLLMLLFLMLVELIMKMMVL